jgi:hypothetical protein
VKRDLRKRVERLEQGTGRAPAVAVIMQRPCETLAELDARSAAERGDAARLVQVVFVKPGEATRSCKAPM